jgi:hypothetical protein
MTDLSSRELIDAIVRSLKRTGRRFARPKMAAADKGAKGAGRPAKSKALSKKSTKAGGRRRSHAKASRA